MTGTEELSAASCNYGLVSGRPTPGDVSPPTPGAFAGGFLSASLATCDRSLPFRSPGTFLIHLRDTGEEGPRPFAPQAASSTPPPPPPRAPPPPPPPPG